VFRVRAGASASQACVKVGTCSKFPPCPFALSTSVTGFGNAVAHYRLRWHPTQAKRQVSCGDHIVGKAELRPPWRHAGVVDLWREQPVEQAVSRQRRHNQPQRALEAGDGQACEDGHDGCFDGDDVGGPAGDGEQHVIRRDDDHDGRVESAITVEAHHGRKHTDSERENGADQVSHVYPWAMTGKRNKIKCHEPSLQY